MALFHCNFLSKALFSNTEATIFIPSMRFGDIAGGEPYPYRPGRKYPVLYLLHGYSGDHTDWITRTNILGFAEDRQLAVVMPGVMDSYYCNMAQGKDFWTYVSEELPLFMESMFPISGKREDTFVAGLSMGGYGAMRLALLQSERFAAAATLSGFLDVSQTRGETLQAIARSYKKAFGEGDPVGTKNDLLFLMEECTKNGTILPRIYQACGTADDLLDGNRKFHAKAKESGIDITYIEEEGAGHEWGFWDRQIKQVLDWLPLHVQGGT